MTAKIQTKTGSDAGRRTDGVTTMVPLKGDPAAILKDVQLPKGVSLGFYATEPEAIASLKKELGAKAGRARKFSSLSAERPGPRSAIRRDAFRPSTRARALLQGIRIAEEDLRAAGGAYSLDEVAALLHGISRQAVDKRVQEGSLLAVPGPSNRRMYPTIQFQHDGSLVEGLRAVRRALPTDNPWTILNFLVHPDDRLGSRKPIDLLKAGEVELVVEAARRLGEQGA
ncbi:hypothetical protein GCM10007874_70230 [Labrys miyagiensis]|uniref:Antitoxin Xre/MbcA/ParS-like toxin-binding domain-containing protein n=1 Tax=Labrys miyagiensis TaxID=346912 RepID=A0ABQ6CUF8_9HYPH|nr:hypothetical protein [Labrys miyagiensis]GLS24002.1 hypothetical protein GCM10007874_70230 [Labrys miyagiensis]